VKGLVIGIVRDLGPAGDALDEANRRGIEDAARILREAGAIIREIHLPAPLTQYREASSVINWSESFSIHEADLLERAHLMGRALRAKMMTGFCVRTADYLAALRLRRALAVATDAVVRSVDALLIPGAFHVAPSLAEPETVPHFTRDAACSVFNLSGHPAFSICTGYDEGGLPTNMQVVGRYFDEPTVLRVAQAYEAATAWRQRRPSLDPVTQEAKMPDTSPPAIPPDLLAEAQAHARRYGLAALSPDMLAELATLFDKAASTGLAIPRMASKEDEPAHVFRVPLS
jgi:aspartyl-tRNA(Asn)/glutamyl-tRNA(Gln) amidotransferase subunit A